MLPNKPAGTRRIVVISDFCEGSCFRERGTVEDLAAAWQSGTRGQMPFGSGTAVSGEPEVAGGYLERLPLAVIREGLCDAAEIWTHWARDDQPAWRHDTPHLTRRSFWADSADPPYASRDMLGHIAAFGQPEILCVWGLGVDEAILSACPDSIKIYNSIDAPALRIPPDVSRHFDLVLTGADWQSREVTDRHPNTLTEVMPIGPEFASAETFFPLGLEKIYDVIYVAAAQAYKRHDVLFDALSRMPRPVKALCVCGYGELVPELRARAENLGISVDFVGPPGVDHAEVNRLMNLAKVGVVCGVDDGAPAILTEYMLCGLPVLANSELKCGLQYIMPSTGRMASAAEFPIVLDEMLTNLAAFTPTETALQLWTWPHTVERFAELLREAKRRKFSHA